jgi:Protein of unknown function (DUF3300)
MFNKLSTTTRSLAVCAALWSVATMPVYAQAQVQDPAPALSAATPAQSQPQDSQTFSQAQIDQLVAPIALYPDSLLTQLLMASTYPLEVVEAARWSHDNPSVTGQALETAMQAQSWDPSVKALAAVPQTLQMMSDKLDWTEQLGDAFLAQQQDVLAAVQTLRAEAQAAGNLQSTPQQVVMTAAPPAGGVAEGTPRPIVIEPVNPDVYYVPVYNPAVVYGAWEYPAYQPFYWSPPGFVASNVVSFAAGVAVGAAIWGNCDWWNHNVVINVNRYNIFNHTNITNNVWVHNPAHRGDVPYRSAALSERFGRGNEAAARDAFRDRAGVERNDMFRDHPAVLPNEAAKDRVDIPREDASRDHVDMPRDDASRDHIDAQHVDAPRDVRERADDGARGALDRRDADIGRDGGDRRIDHMVAPDRAQRSEPMRPRMPSFHPERAGGGFREHMASGRRW